MNSSSSSRVPTQSAPSKQKNHVPKKQRLLPGGAVLSCSIITVICLVVFGKIEPTTGFSVASSTILKEGTIREVAPEAIVPPLSSHPENALLAESIAPLESKGYEVVFDRLQNIALQSSSPEALFQMGAAQMFGRGTVTNYTLARKNLFSALRSGHADAPYLLGISYLSGLGSSSNEVLAYRLFQTAIEKGSRLGFAEAGRMREVGWGVSQDKNRAFALYSKGAALGDPYCMKRLALLSISDKAHYQVDQEMAEQWQPDIEQQWLRIEARLLLPQDQLY